MSIEILEEDVSGFGSIVGSVKSSAQRMKTIPGQIYVQAYKSLQLVLQIQNKVPDKFFSDHSDMFARIGGQLHKIMALSETLSKRGVS